MTASRRSADGGGRRAGRAFFLLLALFPRDFREAFGDEMRDVFTAQLRAARREGRGAVARLWLRTVAGMTSAAWRERRATRVPPRHGLPWHEILAADARLAARLLARAPLFACIVIATIAIGVGGVATVFSALNALVFRPLPGTTDGLRLVGIERRAPDPAEGRVSASYGFYRDLASTCRSFEGVAAWARVSLSIARGAQGVAASGNIVSGNYFTVLGVRPELGRFFLPDEDTEPLAHPVVVVSHDFWQHQLGGDPSVVGGAVTVNGREYRLVGVAPKGFRGVFTPIRVDAWVPLAMQPHVRPGRDLERMPWLWVFGRLRQHLATAAARAELSALAAAWTSSGEDDPQFRRYTNMALTPLTGLPDDARRALLGFGAVLLGAAVLVLLIASANVSSLLAARAVARRREIGVRVALGATRGRLVRQLLTETLALFVIGAIGGTLLASAATSALEHLPLPTDAALSLELSPDGRVLAVSIAVSLVVGLIFGAGPALYGVGRNPGALLRATSAATGRRTLVTNVLIATQVACSLVLLTAAGLFVRSVAAGAAIDPRFDPGGVVVVAFNTEAYGYDEARGRAFYDVLRRGLERAPAVERVSFSTQVPLTFSDTGGIATVEDSTAGPRRIPVRNTVVDTEYFATLRIALAAGRDFRPADARGIPVAIVNETFAQRAWPDGAAVGRTFSMSGRRMTVVGVARDSHYTTLDEAAVAFVYLPLAQEWQATRTLFVRGRGGVLPPAALVEETVVAIDASLPRPVVSTLTHETGVVLLPQRVAAMVTGMLGALGLALSSVGLYGLVAYGVSLRTREIGVRMALGARAPSVVRLVLRGGVRLVLAGTALGLLASLTAGRFIGPYLLAVSPFDPLAFAAAAAVLATVTAAASYVPARRAARISPIEAMREST